jgi:hypothetical protein
MPDLISTIQHLADLPLYKIEKPYSAALPTGTIDPSIKTHNLVFKDYEGIRIIDIRDNESKIGLVKSGFEIIPHGVYEPLETKEDLLRYQRDTATFLKEHFDAMKVICYESKVMAKQFPDIMSTKTHFIVAKKRILLYPSGRFGRSNHYSQQGDRSSRRCYCEQRTSYGRTKNARGRQVTVAQTRVSLQNCQVSMS